MNNSTGTDLFNNNFEIPAFEAGTSVPAQSVSTTTQKTTEENQYITYIGIGLALLIVFVVIVKLIKNNSQNTNLNKIEKQQNEKTEYEENIRKPKAVEIRARKHTSSFATPTNLNQCIRLFLENTRTKN